MVNITFKDLRRQKFVLSFEDSDLVSDVKKRISEEKGWAASSQKLIYSGKILKDEEPIGNYKIEEKGFVVCMVNEPKPVPKPPSTPAATEKASLSTPAAPAAAPAPSTSAVTVADTPTPAGSAPQASRPGFDDPGALAIGPQRAEAIANLEAMGFPRDQIDRAMRAAFFNPDRAVEYILTGIPEHLDQPDRPAQASSPARSRPAAAAAAAASPAQASAAPASAGTESAPAAPPASTSADSSGVNLFDLAARRIQDQSAAGRLSGAAGGVSGTGAAATTGGADGTQVNMDFLRNNQQFQQLRQVVQQNPQMLEPILQQIGASNPRLSSMIGEDPEQFLRMLDEEPEGDAPLVPGAQAISVTEEERDAIERLCRLGFDRDQAIQAYFACDKNEELAANFLFDQDEEGGQGSQT